MTCTPFLKLPESVRLRIYHYAFGKKRIGDLEKRLYPYRMMHGRSKRESTYFNLLRTCSQIYREASEIMYDEYTGICVTRPVCYHRITRRFWRHALYTNHLQRVKHLFIMLDISCPLSLDFLEMLRLMRSLKEIRISLGTKGPNEFAQVPDWIHKILELVPPHCQVSFGAGDEGSMSRQIIYDRYRDEFTGKYHDGWHQTPWVPVPDESIESILRNAVDCSGTKRKFVVRRQPDLDMAWIEAGVKLSDTVPDCEIGWIASNSEVANVEPIECANRPIKANLAKFEYLFDLPIELRMRIYDLVLAPEGCVRLHNRGSGLTPPLLDLLQTCKQIYIEAREIPFSSNTFICENVKTFPWETSPKVCPRVRRLTILLHIHANIEIVIDQLEESLPEFSALRQVRLMLYDQIPNRVGQAIPPAIYRFAQAVTARGCRLSWGSEKEREREYLQCAVPPGACRKEIDMESIEAGRVLC